MQTLKAIQDRRSIKHYDPDHQMTEQEIETLLSHAILSPTSFNMQNWRFLVVTDPEILQQLRKAALGQAQVTDASITILICADLKAFAKKPTRYWKNAPEELQKIIIPMMGGFYADNPELQRDEAMRSTGMAAQTIMLAAKDMGYDTCPMIGFDPKAVAEIINLPEDHCIGMMITVGKALQPAQSRAGQLPLTEVLIHNQFS